MKRLLLLLFSVAIVISSVMLAPSGDKKTAAPEYRPVAGWPKLPATMELAQVTGVAVDAADRVFVFHRGKNPILVFDKDGVFLRSFGDGLFKTAHGLRIDADQNVWTSDIGNHLVRKFDAKGNLLLTLGQKDKPGVGQDQFNKPADIAFGRAGEIYVADGYGNSRVVKFTKEGKFVLEWGKKGKGEGEFDLPHAIRVDGKGRVYVGDRENNRVQVFDGAGKFLQAWPDTGAPFGLDLTPEGRMLLADGRAHCVRQLDKEGKPLKQWGVKGAGPGEFTLPHGICADSRGAIYVTEVTGSRVQKFVPVRPPG